MARAVQEVLRHLAECHDGIVAAAQAGKRHATLETGLRVARLRRDILVQLGQRLGVSLAGEFIIDALLACDLRRLLVARRQVCRQCNAGGLGDGRRG